MPPVKSPEVPQGRPQPDRLADILNCLGDIQSQLDGFEAYLKAISGEVDRLGKLADQAEKFLHNPIGAYKAARGKLIPRGPSA